MFMICIIYIHIVIGCSQSLSKTTFCNALSSHGARRHSIGAPQ